MPHCRLPRHAPQVLALADTALHAAVEELDIDELVDPLLEPMRLGGDSMLRGAGFCMNTGLDPLDFAGHEPW